MKLLSKYIWRHPASHTSIAINAVLYLIIHFLQFCLLICQKQVTSSTVMFLLISQLFLSSVDSHFSYSLVPPIIYTQMAVLFFFTFLHFSFLKLSKLKQQWIYFGFLFVSLMWKTFMNTNSKCTSDQISHILTFSHF